MDKPVIKKFLLFCSFILATQLLNAAITPDQLELLESLPADQRDSILKKMETVDKLQEDIDDTFENESNLVRRPEYEDLEDVEIDELCEECIFGYEFFKYSPTTFATSSFSITPDYVLGPGDKIELNYYGSEDLTFEAFIARDGSLFVPRLGPVYLSGMTFSKATEFIDNKVKKELIGVDVS